MRPALILACLAGLAACGAPKVVQPSISGGSRADGIVALSSTTSIYQPVQPDLVAALAAASRRCRSWGYRGSTALAGTREVCGYYDSWGRCTQTRVTRHYDCMG